MTKRKSVEEKVATATRKLLEQDSSAVIETILSDAFWPRALEPGMRYRRVSDDTSGDITVIFSRDADGWIEVLSRLDPKEPLLTHRFRSYFGGGESEHVRNTLLIIATAIKLDNESRPQDHRRKIQNPP